LADFLKLFFKETVDLQEKIFCTKYKKSALRNKKENYKIIKRKLFKIIYKKNHMI
jgi:hypothetical protein